MQSLLGCASSGRRRITLTQRHRPVDGIPNSFQYGKRAERHHGLPSQGKESMQHILVISVSTVLGLALALSVACGSRSESSETTAAATATARSPLATTTAQPALTTGPTEQPTETPSESLEACIERTSLKLADFSQSSPDDPIIRDAAQTECEGIAEAGGCVEYWSKQLRDSGFTDESVIAQAAERECSQ